MGLLFIKQIEGAVLGVWEITESPDKLEQHVVLNAEEANTLKGLKNEQRKKHWLSYRHIVPHLKPHLNQSGILYDVFGKPFPADRSAFVSVSHSGKYSAMMASKTRPVGIDIEQIHPRIQKVTTKFLTKDEKAWLGDKTDLESLCLIWGAKESLFKLYGKGQLVFSEHIGTEPFIFMGSGHIWGYLLTHEKRKRYQIHYETIDDYILVYTMA